MYSNQQQQTHTPESVLPREEDVHALLLHHLWQVRKIAGTRAASITVSADTFDTSLGVRVKWKAYIDGVPGRGGEFQGVKEALEDMALRAADFTVDAQVLALRAKADELERGIQ
jgi:hypothetical protein